MTRPGFPLFNGAKPVLLVAPVASGTVVIGNVLSSTTGTWASVPAATFSYQWQRDGVDIGGATANTYTVVAADIGSSITAVVTASNPAGSASASSNALAFAWTDIGAQNSWRADAGLTLVSGTHVSDWTDSIGGIVASQGVDATRPTAGVTIGTNARAALNFNGSQALANAVTSLLAAGSARSFFVVAKSGTAQGGSPFSVRTTNPRFNLDVYTSGGVDFIYNDGVNAPQNTSVTAGTLANKTSDFYADWSFSGAGNAPAFGFNGVVAVVLAGVQGTESGTAGFAIGQGIGNWLGNLAEIVVASVAWTANQRLTARAYARNYYGLP